MSENPQKQAGQNASSNDSNDPQTLRDIDPNVLQRRAAQPEASVWVSASAGTGKTKVLTDRVLRLLLPRDDGSAGTQAHKILCLTFTKAAASEMALRINETLASWAVLPLDGSEGKTLKSELKKLLGREAHQEEIGTARRLFADVIDVPGGLKIMTIHAFCQSILGRFPLEARINPHFTVLDDQQARALMNTAQGQILNRAQNEKNTLLAGALSHIAATINEDQFLELLGNISSERSQIERLLTKLFDIDGLYTNLCKHLDVPAGQTPQDLLHDACQKSAFEEGALLNAAKIMAEGGSATDKTASQKILDWLSLAENERSQGFFAYKSAFLKKTDGQIKAKLVTQKINKDHPDILDILQREGERLISVKEAINNAQMALLTRDLLLLGQAVLEEYSALKNEQAALDFDDLIIKTLNLMRGESMDLDAKMASGWIHYKLDQGLDHILIDEAQDTNPEQWQIVETLCNEFFDNTENNNTVRSVFTVGDEKQSIYSFQRASPEEFARMQNHFRQKTQDARLLWDSVPMNISFRSTQSVLKAVDATFADPQAKAGLGTLPIEHKAFRRGQAGLAELWPLFESDETEIIDLWTPVKDASEAQSGRKKLALHIAATIKNWIDSGEILESKNRAIRPGDIMILMRTRSALVNQIARELKNLNIAVSGLDRMVLSEELAVQDLLAAAEFTLQPLDNLSLACILKSPLIGLNEDQLYDLCIDRDGESLWSRIQASDQEDLKTYLRNLQQKSASLGPFAFFSHILQTPCPGDKTSGRRAIMGRLGADAMDPLDELLNLARDFEQNQPANLQHFIHHQRAQNHEIKRQQHGDADEVRIMTVHGSKGLQAPIVILPDGASSAAGAPSKISKRLLWPGQTGLDVPLWSPRKDMDSHAFTQAMDTVKARLDEEYRRLLYVAMTRSEDRLYIGGALNKKQKAETLQGGCWYRLVQTGLESIEDVESLGSGALRITNPQIHEPDGKPDKTQDIDNEIEIPDWLRESAPAETQKEVILRPSRIADSSLSPLKNAGTYRFLRGNLTHKLLQLLPELPSQRWEDASTGFLKRYGQGLTPDIRSNIIRETLAILNHPDFAPLFGPESLSEVPITGHLDGKGLISGQIDRLRITDDTIWIIDFKTNRPPPQDADQIPQIYQEQMQTYAAILSQIYEGRTIKAALLWTDGPFLMPLDLESV